MLINTDLAELDCIELYVNGGFECSFEYVSRLMGAIILFKTIENSDRLNNSLNQCFTSSLPFYNVCEILRRTTQRNISNLQEDSVWKLLGNNVGSYHLKKL